MKKTYGALPLIILAVAAGIPILLGGLRIAFYQPPKPTVPEFPIWTWFLIGVGILVLLKMISRPKYYPSERY